MGVLALSLKIHSGVEKGHYTVYRDENKIFIGNGYIHDMITIEMLIDGKYKLSHCQCFDFHQDYYPGIDNIDRVWVNLNKLIANDTWGELKTIINEPDWPRDNEKHITVYTFKTDRGKVITTQCIENKMCWPNVDIEGRLIYDNTYFSTKKEAKKKLIVENLLGVKWNGQWVIQDLVKIYKSLIKLFVSIGILIRSYFN